MLKDAIDRIRALENRATSFAAYGLAVVTLLSSQAPSLARAGNQWTSLTALAASFCGIACMYFSIKVLSVRNIEIDSQDEWLKKECLSGPLVDLKKFRIRMTWRSLTSRLAANQEKSRALRKAETWLIGAALYSVCLLIHLLCLRALSYGLREWLISAVPNDLAIQTWPRILSGLCNFLILGLIFIPVFRRARRV